MAEDIAQWLNRRGLGQYAQAFADNAVDLETLPHLSDDDLTELGLPLGHRRKLQAAIGALATDGEAPRPTSPLAQDHTPQPADAERRQLTVLFCDIVGSTELSAKLDPEDMRDVLLAYHEACTKVIARYDGYVAKFMGDGVYAYFGYPTAHEDDAERAVNAGLGIVKSIDELNAEHGALAVRIGIATGNVTVGDLIGEGASEEAAIVGEAPNLAARLQTIAEPNTVVIGEATHTLAGGMFESTDLGAQDLKGFSDPVGAWRVLRARISESRFQATRGEHLTELVGREEELDTLLRRWRRAKEGEGQVVLISGEPGIGKSRLLHAIRESVDDDSSFIRTYQFSPQHTNSAMFPFIEQMQRVIGLAPEDSDAVKLEKLETWIRVGYQTPEKLAPIYGPALGIDMAGRYPAPNVSPQRQKEMMFDGFFQRLQNLSSRKPVLYLVEDMHWIDPTSLELLCLHIERCRGVERLLFLFTSRPEFEAPWLGQPHTMLLSLNRLDKAQCAALVVNSSGGTHLPEAVIERIVERTDGVPLFVEELTKSIVESGAFGADGKNSDATPSESTIPLTLQDALEARLDRLGPTKEIAEIGAVIGRTFDYRLLSFVAGLEEEALNAALDELVGSGLAIVRGLPPDATYTFKHALIQDTAYQSLLRGRRAELHGRIATALKDNVPEILSSEPEIIAYHFTEAGLFEPAIEHWQAAGRRAIQQSATSESIEHFNRGLNLLMELPESYARNRNELTFQTELGSAMAARYGWASREAENCFSHARELCSSVGDERELFPILWGFWMIYGARSERGAWRETANELLQIAQRQGDTDMLLEAHHASWGSPFHGEFLSQIEHANQGLAIYDPTKHRALAPQYGGHDAGVCGNCHKSIALWVTGFPDQSRAALAAAIILADEISYPPSSVQALMMSGFLHAFDRNWSETLRTHDEALALTTEHGSQLWVPRLLTMRGWALVALGDTDEGLSEIRRSVEMARKSGHFGNTTSLVFQAEAFRMAGLREEALSVIVEVLPILKEEGEQLWEANAHVLKGELLLEQFDDRQPDAETCFQNAIDIARSQAAKMWELRAATSLARLWHGQGRTDESRDLLAPLYGWFTEGSDTADLTEAKALLDELG